MDLIVYQEKNYSDKSNLRQISEELCISVIKHNYSIFSKLLFKYLLILPLQVNLKLMF